VIFYYSRPSFPIRTVIKNIEGKSLDVVIIGKIADTIYFNRMPDKTRFTLPLDQLAFKDRTYLTLLKGQAPPPTEPTVKPKYEDNYIQNRVENIEDLKEKLKVMELEVASDTLNPVLKNDYARRIADLEHEIKTLEVAIETHRYRLKKD
jgi:hypothetical protein